MKQDEGFAAQLVSWRRQIHSCPELGFCEHNTAALVAELGRMGYAYRCGTGVVGERAAALPPTLSGGYGRPAHPGS